MYCEVIKLLEGSCLREPSIIEVPFPLQGLVELCTFALGGAQVDGPLPGLQAILEFLHEIYMFIL